VPSLAYITYSLADAAAEIAASGDPLRLLALRYLGLQHSTYSLASYASEILTEHTGLSTVMRTILNAIQTRPTKNADDIKDIEVAGEDMLRLATRYGPLSLWLYRSELRLSTAFEAEDNCGWSVPTDEACRILDASGTREQFGVYVSPSREAGSYIVRVRMHIHLCDPTSLDTLGTILNVLTGAVLFDATNDEEDQ